MGLEKWAAFGVLGIPPSVETALVPQSTTVCPFTAGPTYLFFLLSQDSGAGDIVAFPPLFEPSGLGDKRLKDLHLILSWMLSIQFGTYLLLHPCEVRCCLC